MSQLTQIGTHKTSIKTENGFTCVRYWSTDVVKFNAEKVILNSGGYSTLTTKTRMNQAANQFNLPYTVFQKDYEWFVEFDGETIPFYDNMELKLKA